MRKGEESRKIRIWRKNEEGLGELGEIVLQHFMRGVGPNLGGYMPRDQK